MGITVSNSGGGTFAVTPAGTWKARCYSVVDLGTQKTEYQGDVNYKRQVRISWELIDAPRMEDGRPFSIHKTYTQSLHEKATLRHHLVSWRGREFTAEEEAAFDLDAIIGKACLIGVIQKKSPDGKKTYANIQAILSAPDKEIGPMENAPVSFSIAEPDMDLFNSFSEWLQKKIQECREWSPQDEPAHVTDEQVAAAYDDLDVPF